MLVGIWVFSSPTLRRLCHSFIHPFIQQIVEGHLCTDPVLGSGNPTNERDKTLALTGIFFQGWEKRDNKQTNKLLSSRLRAL